jgi:ABC-type Fe3+ transport system permease subunit
MRLRELFLYALVGLVLAPFATAIGSLLVWLAPSVWGPRPDQLAAVLLGGLIFGIIPALLVTVVALPIALAARASRGRVYWTGGLSGSLPLFALSFLPLAVPHDLVGRALREQRPVVMEALVIGALSKALIGGICGLACAWVLLTLRPIIQSPDR